LHIALSGERANCELCVGVCWCAACRIYSCGVLGCAGVLPAGSTAEVGPERSVLIYFKISAVTTLQFPAYCCSTGHKISVEPRSTAADPIKLHYCTCPVRQPVNCNRRTDCSERFCSSVATATQIALSPDILGQIFIATLDKYRYM
jgi:hypothetical protein